MLPCSANTPYRGKLGAYEGAFASRNPYAPVPFGAQGFRAGPGDLILGRFGWANPDTGLVANSRTSGYLLGLVLPRFGSWAVVYWNAGALYLRSGKAVVLAQTGDFYVRFPAGAGIGQPVYAEPTAGQAYTVDGGGYSLTPWRAVQNVQPGCLGIISPYQNFPT